MLWRKKKEPTLVEQAVGAVDRIQTEVNDLHEERMSALSTFRETANWLAEINGDLCQRIDLCETLTSQLHTAVDNMSKQVADNDKVRDKILDIIGE